MRRENLFEIPKKYLRAGTVALAIGIPSSLVGLGIGLETNSLINNSDQTIKLTRSLINPDNISADFPQPKITFPNICKDCVDPEIFKNNS